MVSNNESPLLIILKQQASRDIKQRGNKIYSGKDHESKEERLILRLNDALCAYCTTFKTPIGTIPFKLVVNL